MVFRVYTQLVLAAGAIAILSTNCNAFTTTQFHCNSKSSVAMSMITPSNNNHNNEEQDIVSSRRSILSSFLTTAVVGGASILSLPDNALAEAETMERGGVQLTPFNSLAFNYRGTFLLLVITLHIAFIILLFEWLQSISYNCANFVHNLCAMICANLCAHSCFDHI
jgi:hypothetical protein